jgi:hypothetical protein
MANGVFVDTLGFSILSHITTPLFVAPVGFLSNSLYQEDTGEGDAHKHSNARWITSIDDFVKQVGSFEPEHKLHVTLRTYFENRGPKCYVVPNDHLELALYALPEVNLVVAAGQDIFPQVLDLTKLHEDVFFCS